MGQAGTQMSNSGATGTPDGVGPTQDSGGISPSFMAGAMGGTSGGTKHMNPMHEQMGMSAMQSAPQMQQGNMNMQQGLMQLLNNRKQPQQEPIGLMQQGYQGY